MGNRIEVDIKKNLDYMIIGEKVVSYRNPLVIDEIKEHNGMVTIDAKQINGYWMAFDKKNFIEKVKEFLGEIE